MTENCCEEKFNQAVCSKVRQLIDKRESESRKTSNQRCVKQMNVRKMKVKVKSESRQMSNQRCVKQMNVSKMNTAVETKRLRSS